MFWLIQTLTFIGVSEELIEEYKIKNPKYEYSARPGASWICGFIGGISYFICVQLYWELIGDMVSSGELFEDTIELNTPKSSTGSSRSSSFLGSRSFSLDAGLNRNS